MALTADSFNKLTHVVVAGGSGYIGKSVISRLRESGCRVTVLGRNSGNYTDDAGLRHVFWSMGSPLQEGLFSATEDLSAPDALIYLSHNWNTRGLIDEDPNLSAFKQLLSTIRLGRPVRVVLASSVSARVGALNRYGQIKFQMEELLEGPEECAARIGLVYGGEASGQWSMIRRISGFRVLPMLDPWVRVQPIHIDDVAEGLIRLASLKILPKRTWGIAGPVPVKFGRFLKVAARMVHGRRLTVLPLPSFLVLFLLASLSKVPFVPVPDRERILGLIGLPIIRTARDLRHLSLTSRPLALGLATRGNTWRREVLREAYVHLAYVNGTSPGIGELRTYVRLMAGGLNANDAAVPIRYPGLFLWLPWLVRVIDPPAGTSRLRRRLLLALQIAERRGRLSAKVFHYRDEPSSASWARMFSVGCVELLLMPTRLLAFCLASK